MKKLIFIASAFLLTSCLKEVTKEGDKPIVINPNPTLMNELVVPDGFLYKTVSNILLKVKLLTINDLPLKNVKVDVLDETQENKGNIIATGFTDINGNLNIDLDISVLKDKVIINTDYIGLINNVIVPLKGVDETIDFTIGGKEPLKLLSADVKNNFSNTKSLGKAFNRLNFKLGTFTFGMNGGVPNYLVTPKDVITASFLNDINAIIPEQVSVPTNNPGLLLNGVQKDLVLTNTTDVWLNFLHEGAAIRNSLFYFTYNINNKPTTQNDIDSLIAVFPNASFTGSGGNLFIGDKVRLGRFGPDTAIGFALAQNGWAGTTVNSNVVYIFSIKELNDEVNPNLKEHVVSMRDVATSRFLVGFEDGNRDDIFCDNDFNDCLFYLNVSNLSNVDLTNTVTTTPFVIADSDGDGVLNTFDEYPNDITRAFNVYYPNAGNYASVAFEDLWPSKGDHDLNDIVVNYQYKGVLNSSNKMVDLIGKFKLRAAGGVFKNAFCVELPFNKSVVQNISGGNGLDAAANKAILRVFNNSTSILRSFNTQLGQPVVVTDTISMSLTFKTPQSTSLGVFNPFIFVDETGKGRGHEIHLPGLLPTELVNNATFGTSDDNTNLGLSRYYLTKRNLPYAISTPVNFDYPTEKTPIISAYTKFAAWVQSGGTSYADWYLNLPGYRVTNKTY